MSPSRRTVLKTLAAAATGSVTGVVAHGYLWERHHLTLVRTDLPISGLAPALDGLRVGLVTDLHHSRYVSAGAVREAAAVVMREQPDLVVLGGDYVSFFDRAYARPCAEALAGVSAPHGVFAILGNHDDDREVPAALAAQGFEVLADQRTVRTIRGERLELAGLRFWTRRAQDVAEVLQGAAAPVLLLAHDPRRLEEAAALDVAAVLSGHTHGGQVVLPGVGPLAGRRFPVIAGLASRGSTSIFVSRGVGTVIVPVRINCPPEVAVLTLRRVGRL